ncbi:MAG: hypothetical protein PHR61_03925 [Candidatus Absconditabacteria bacterium]|jgi:hypothetical protein|nr:hypothetical protein [Candidatus Absconditabacteria bacterium]
MKKSRIKPLIDTKQLERELRENGYNEWDIEEIILRAKDINERHDRSSKEVNEFMFSMKEKVY